MGLIQLLTQPSPQPPRVITPEFQLRLGRLNHAIRELRGLGLQVVWSRLSGPFPQAHIQRDADVSLGALMDRMGPRNFLQIDGCTVVSGVFEGVTVSWVEPQAH